MYFKNDLTQEELKSLLNYDEKTGVFTWKISRGKAKEGFRAGSNKAGYRAIILNRKPYQEHRLAWLYMYGKFPNGCIDHKDGNPSNNKINNLREATFLENQHNTKKPITNTSGVKGVYFNKATKKWQASIRVDGKLKHLGTYKNKEDAISVRKHEAEKYHKEFVNHGY